MAGPMEGPVRAPAVAGMFYPSSPEECREMARRFVETAPRREAAGAPWIGGIVPHAGWICSAAIAGETVANIARTARGAADVVVIFGAVHTPLPLEAAALDTYARWDLPGEASPIAAELRDRLCVDAPERFEVDERFHVHEHAVEVELPLVQYAFPGASVLPVEVPLIDDAIAIGRDAARAVVAAGLKPVFLASSDLTHYGPAYRFAPAGVGLQGLEWAKDNDRRLLERIVQFRPEQIVEEVRENSNACGGGAIAAMLSACRELGAWRAALLRHANSYETLAGIAPQGPDSAVGYAAVVVG